MLLKDNNLEVVREKVEDKRQKLISLAESDAKINDLDRKEIIYYLKDLHTPTRPDSIPLLMKHFLKSCFSYSVIRRFNQKKLGEIPMPEVMPKCMDLNFHYEEFYNDEWWYPVNLAHIAEHIQSDLQLDLSSKKPINRMLLVMLKGSKVMEARLEAGLDIFYHEIDEICKKGPEAMWNYAKASAEDIPQVGVALYCDFLKEIGFTNFVKVDWHLIRQMNALGVSHIEKPSDKQHFIMSIKLAQALGVTPYYIDRVLYEWGRCNKEINAQEEKL